MEDTKTLFKMRARALDRDGVRRRKGVNITSFSRNERKKSEQIQKMVF